MAATQSFASRRPQARAALPPFTLPPPPEFPRAAAAAAAAADGMGLVPPSSASGVQQRPAGSPYSTASSPGGYSASTASSVPALSARGSLSPYEAHRPCQPSDGKGPGPGQGQSHAQGLGQSQSGLLSHPHGHHSPRKPLPGSPPQSSPARYAGGKLPSIASLIPPSSSQYPPRSPSLPAPGYLAMPGSGRGLAPSPFASGFKPSGPATDSLRHWGMRTLVSSPPQGPGQGDRYYHEFAVPEYPVLRESSQQDRPFKCDLCKQCFSRNHDLKRHKRIHMAAKPFPCPTCNKSFSRRDALKRHWLVKACYKKAEAQAAAAAAADVADAADAGEKEATETDQPPSSPSLNADAEAKASPKLKQKASAEPKPPRTLIAKTPPKEPRE